MNQIELQMNNNEAQEPKKQSSVNVPQLRKIKKYEEVWRQIKMRIKNQFGIIFATMSAFTFSLGGIFYIKAISLNGSDTSILRYSIQLISMIILLKYKKISLLGAKEQRKLLIARSIFGIFAVVFSNFAIKYIDISDSTAVSHTSVIITAILGKVILKEKFGVQHFFALLLAIIGVMLMTKPTFLFKRNIVLTNLTENVTSENNSCSAVRHYTNTSTYDRIIGISLALVGAFGTGVIHIIIKKLCLNKIHFGVSTLYGSFLGLPSSILTSFLLIITGANHQNFRCEIKHLPFDIAFGLIGGAISVLAIVLMNISLKFEDATKVAFVRTTGKKRMS